TVLFCFIDDAYERLNPHSRRYTALKKLSDSEILTLALFQQLRGIESEWSLETPNASSHICSPAWWVLHLRPSIAA
ncbi:MAG TPA: hypothetical protein VFE21_13270, partial [Rubrobacteraceae bacterium]|nr:hypothetical protein [Rubrobacteraceae bacterium]